MCSRAAAAWEQRFSESLCLQARPAASAYARRPATQAHCAALLSRYCCAVPYCILLWRS